jgi:hypothetical protein
LHPCVVAADFTQEKVEGAAAESTTAAAVGGAAGAAEETRGPGSKENQQKQQHSGLAESLPGVEGLSRVEIRQLEQPQVLVGYQVRWKCLLAGGNDAQRRWK